MPSTDRPFRLPNLPTRSARIPLPCIASCLCGRVTAFTMRPFVRMMGLTATWSSYGQLMHSLRTGQPAAAELLSWQKLRDVDCGHELWTQPHPTLRRFGSRVPKTNVHDSMMGTRVADRFFGSSMTAVSAGRTVR